VKPIASSMCSKQVCGAGAGADLPRHSSLVTRHSCVCVCVCNMYECSVV
jgi:hypothetical protein